MNNVIKSVRVCTPTVPFAPQNKLGKARGVRLRRVTTISSDPDSPHNMDKAQNPIEKTGDVMSHSFGEGYATRSDEEGFGGVYGGNQEKANIRADKEIHEDHPAYDKTQGSEVKEKERSRHQK